MALTPLQRLRDEHDAHLFLSVKRAAATCSKPAQPETKTPFSITAEHQSNSREYTISLLPPPLSVTYADSIYLKLAFGEDRMEGGFLILQLRDFVTSKGNISC